MTLTEPGSFPIRLAPDFLRQMTGRYGIATLVQIAAVPVVIAAPRVGVSIALLCVTFFLLPQPKPRYKPGQAPNEAEKLNAYKIARGINDPKLRTAWTAHDRTKGWIE